MTMITSCVVECLLIRECNLSVKCTFFKVELHQMWQLDIAACALHKSSFFDPSQLL
jgi:hypothetical protein